MTELNVRMSRCFFLDMTIDSELESENTQVKVEVLHKGLLFSLLSDYNVFSICLYIYSIYLLKLYKLRLLSSLTMCKVFAVTSLMAHKSHKQDEMCAVLPAGTWTLPLSVRHTAKMLDAAEGHIEDVTCL